MVRCSCIYSWSCSQAARPPCVTASPFGHLVRYFEASWLISNDAIKIYTQTYILRPTYLKLFLKAARCPACGLIKNTYPIGDQIGAELGGIERLQDECVRNVHYVQQ